MYKISMKKPAVNPVGRLHKPWIVMKLSIAILLAAMMEVSAHGFAQEITYRNEHARLEQVFSEIRKQTGYNVLWSARRLQSAKAVSVDFKNTPLEDALKTCLAGQPFTYSIERKTILIREAPEPIRIVSTRSENPAAIDVSGRVTDSNGQPVEGVTIQIKGTQNGTYTNAAGEFTIDAPVNGVLVVSSIGFLTQEIPVNNQTVIRIVLQNDEQTLGEVTITALGLERSTRSLTYATQNVSEEELNRVKDPNFMNSMAGKAAGVVITKGSGGPGASTRVLLRGNKSILGSNQPLYVIDGVPMNNASSTSSNTLFSQQDFGDAISNLNPEDIESVQVLQGASAAALYGSQAANGVILVTTKKGKKGSSSVQLSSTATFENPIGLPENQTGYGQREPGVSNESWGAAITNGKNTHISDFFNTGVNYLNSLSISTGSEIGQLYFSYGNTHAKGIVPENRLNRNNFNLRATTQLFNDKLSLDGSVNYINQGVYNRPQSGYYLSPIFSLYLFPTEDDFSEYDANHFETWDPVRGLYQQNWPYIVNEASSNQNPYWIQHRNQNDMIRERTIAAFTAKYAITDWLDIQARTTYDRVHDRYEQRLHATTDPLQASVNGGYTKNASNTDQWYSDVLLTANDNLGTDFSLSATLGASNTYIKTSATNLGSITASGLSYANFFSVYALQFPFNATESLRKTLNQAVFASANIGYRSTLYLDATARNEWSNTVNLPFFYPSVGLSYVLTESIGSSDVLSFAKLRASYSEVGNTLPFGVANYRPPYTIDNNENVNPRGTLPFFSGTDTVDLKPERTRSFELGAELRLLRNKLSVNLTYYNATTFDQVFTIGAPAGSGASNFYINGGTIRNKGLEGLVSYQVGDGDFQWTPSLNFSRNINQVVQLSDLLTTPRFVLTSIDATRQVQLFLTRPENGKYGSYGDLYGKRIQYNEDGTVVTDNNGLPVLSANPDEYIGNANPSFLAGFNNTFAYKNFSVGFLIDSRWGGKIVSVTETWRDWKGLSQRTADARNNGGVTVNGNLVDAEAYYKRISGTGQQGAAELYAYDATNIRLRELSVSYSFPQFTPGIKDLNISFVGRNLFFFHKKAPFDPEVSIAPANGLQGIEGFNMPSTRSYGVSLRATF